MGTSYGFYNVGTNVADSADPLNGPDYASFPPNTDWFAQEASSP
jgi:hypothetical protein